MSKHELLESYSSGLIGRRDFIRGLVTLGASVSAATAYAVALRPATEASAASCYYTIPEEYCNPLNVLKLAVNARRGGGRPSRNP